MSRQLHPICVMVYFVLMIGITVSTFHPVMIVISLLGALCFLGLLKRPGEIAGWMKMMIPIVLIVFIANPIFNHRGVTPLFMLFNQWITLEALCYGAAAGLALASLILWCACYQEIMTGDKILYLFGRVVPTSALLIDMSLQLVTTLKHKLKVIKEAQQMLYGKPETKREAFGLGIKNMSALLSWGMEDSIHTADSMKARGFGVRKRTSFHLFRFESKDVIALLVILTVGTCVVACRILGYGVMDYYPKMSPLYRGGGSLILFISYGVFAFLPAMIDGKEKALWHSYGLSR